MSVIDSEAALHVLPCVGRRGGAEMAWWNMRRLKEGFYSIMKLADAVKDRGEAAKDEMRGFVRDNKIEKPITEAIIQIAPKKDVEDP